MRGLLFGRVADMRRPDSWITHLRQRRMAFFFGLLARLPEADPARPLQLLDVGGTAFFWHMLGFDSTPSPAMLIAGESWDGSLVRRPIHITLLNLGQPSAVPANFTNLTGDGCAMPQFQDQQFDIVFSNSVIEHVGDFARQRAFADEVRRVGQRYFVQTPNRFFPLEPHFFFPGFQFLPVHIRTWLVQHFALGWFPRIRDAAQARHEVTQIQLLSANSVRRLFPKAQLQSERMLGMTVGLVAYEGWP